MEERSKKTKTPTQVIKCYDAFLFPWIYLDLFLPTRSAGVTPPQDPGTHHSENRDSQAVSPGLVDPSQPQDTPHHPEH